MQNKLSGKKSISIFLNFNFQILKSIPWDKVDIRVMTLEITRAKLNENLSGEHIDIYPDIIDYLDSLGYKEVKTLWHTPEKISHDSVFVRKDLELNVI
jgi:hypothetical protein